MDLNPYEITYIFFHGYIFIKIIINNDNDSNNYNNNKKIRNLISNYVWI